MEGGLFASASSLARFKIRHGYNITKPITVSGHILICKLKKALNKEFTQELFKKYKTNNNYSQQTRVDRADKINKLTNRLNKLPTAAVKVLYNQYETGGIMRLISELERPLKKLFKLREPEQPRNMDTF